MSCAPPRIVLFDLGGVLLPFDRERRVAAIVDRLGCGPDAVRAIFEGDLPGRMDRGEAREADFAAAFGELAGRPVDDDEARELLMSVFEAPNAAVWTLAGELARACAVGGFSDNPAFVTAAFPAGARLDPMIFSADIGAAKPSDAAFDAAERAAGASGCEILFVDDTPANVEAARRRGWDALHYLSPEALRRDLAERGLP